MRAVHYSLFHAQESTTCKYAQLRSLPPPLVAPTALYNILYIHIVNAPIKPPFFLPTTPPKPPPIRNRVCVCVTISISSHPLFCAYTSDVNDAKLASRNGTHTHEGKMRLMRGVGDRKGCNDNLRNSVQQHSCYYYIQVNKRSNTMIDGALMSVCQLYKRNMYSMSIGR